MGDHLGGIVADPQSAIALCNQHRGAGGRDPRPAGETRGATPDALVQCSLADHRPPQRRRHGLVVVVVEGGRGRVVVVVDGGRGRVVVVDGGRGRVVVVVVAGGRGRVVVVVDGGRGRVVVVVAEPGVPPPPGRPVVGGAPPPGFDAAGTVEVPTIDTCGPRPAAVVEEDDVDLGDDVVVERRRGAVVAGSPAAGTVRRP
ncbi:MAG: hypothetical protein HYX34_15070 [Actinobacteria bacterium]|nr:hypothetical protein [Actinomycetota bacterium]